VYHPQKQGFKQLAIVLSMVMFLNIRKYGVSPVTFIVLGIALGSAVLFALIFFYRHRAFFTRGVERARAVFPNSPMYAGYLQNSKLRKKLKPQLRGLRTLVGADQNGVWLIDPKRADSMPHVVLPWKDITDLQAEGDELLILVNDEVLTVALQFTPDNDSFPAKTPDISQAIQDLLSLRPQTQTQ